MDFSITEDHFVSFFTYFLSMVMCLTLNNNRVILIQDSRDFVPMSLKASSLLIVSTTISFTSLSRGLP